MNKAIAAQNGNIVTIEAPEPELREGHVLIRTEYSAISPGTELSMASRSGETPVILGYSAVGIIERVGSEVTTRKPGQRVACYGAPYTRHASILSVPANLTAVVPEGVDPQEAAFAGHGAIAIHALRIADLRFGESAVVVGLGILGNITAQIASAAAFVTLGLDLHPDRSEALRKLGVPGAYDDPAQLAEAMSEATGGKGADSVLLCAGGGGDTLMNQALDWIRDRGKVVVVGDLTTEFSRAKMFAKEAQVLISRAGGPGRYDARYERDNIDYPIGFVRWTEGRNTQEYIRLLAEKRITVKPMINGVFSLDRASEAYEAFKSPGGAMGMLFKHD